MENRVRELPGSNEVSSRKTFSNTENLNAHHPEGSSLENYT